MAKWKKKSDAEHQALKPEMRDLILRFDAKDAHDEVEGGTRPVKMSKKRRPRRERRRLADPRE
jgi:hypothetical protein